MEMNRNMRHLLTPAMMESAKTAELNASLRKIISEGFSRVDGALVFSSTLKLSSSAGIDSFPDLTGYECFVNHLHIEDYLAEADKVEVTEILRQGMAFCYHLESALKELRPCWLRIIMSFDSDSNSCSVRFHALRTGETWLVDDLESYKEDALLVLDVKET